jgi:hypothetical protein
MAYTNSAIVDLGSLPTYSTIPEWIIQTFSHHKDIMMELLSRSLSCINISFNA